MNIDINVLDESEKIIFALRSLYSRYGYERYRMGKFEEYDLYSRNKDFLVSDSVITFTDTNGKLMALKPDVTLSIIKNSKDTPDAVNKLYYNENVYRVSKGSNSFREIMQTGLECIGNVDENCIKEVLKLAAESMGEVTDECMLEVSNLEILSGLTDAVPASGDVKKSLIKCIREKNRHGIRKICSENDIDESLAEDLCELVSIYGRPDEIMDRLSSLCGKYGLETEADRLAQVVSVFDGTPVKGRVVIDFSEVSDMNYYNGIIFRGFISGVPDSVLSGGQYDRLMKKMGRRSKAIGFAVYLDKLHGLMNRRS
ncbi:MAG: ATP phosphoribosyltransferase regulatory subunit [Parasporobacterium sp.]|nr:ATP phosphoribosyltransferase regulatory subunit [Parasporobacterium sp.]